VTVANQTESQAVLRLSKVMRATSLDAASVARILGKDSKTVQRWLRFETKPRWDARELVLALNVVLERLSSIVEPDSAEDWLYTPVPALDNRRPADLIREGESRRVLDLIDAVGEGVFA